MRVSRPGLVAAAAYVVLAVVSVTWGRHLEDATESTLLMQLPVVPVLAALGGLGLLERAMEAPLLVFYGISVALVAFGLYAAFWLSAALGPRAKLGVGLFVLAAFCALVLWPVRR